MSFSTEGIFHAWYIEDGQNKTKEVIYEIICGNDDKENVVGINSFDYNNDNFKKDLSKFIVDYFNNGINNNIKELENKIVEIDNELNKL